MVQLPRAQRLQGLQANVFADMDRAKAAARAAGRDIVDLSLGSSDLPASPTVVEAIATSLQDPTTHGYSLFQSTLPFREAIARWYEAKYGLPVDPEAEVLPLIGSQEGTGHLPLAVLDPGDIALLQDPGYPSHAGGVHLANGTIHWLPTQAEQGYLPVLADIPPEVCRRARLMVLSYPHNPTTAIAPVEFFAEAVAFCQQHAIVLAHDFPYGDLTFDGRPAAPSIFLADRAKTVAIEFYTFSKSYNMGGFRVAFAIGNAEIISALRQVKAVIDFNQYRGILNGAIAALATSQASLRALVATFEARRNAFVGTLEQLGWADIPRPPATMYVWAPLPAAWQEGSLAFCTELVAATGVAVAPGAGFGRSGEGYLRFALVRDVDTLTEAARRIAEFLRSRHLAT